VVGLVGDVMLGRGVSAMLERVPSFDFLGDVSPILTECDGVIANLESPITSHTEKWSGCWKAFHFRAVPAALDLLHAARIRAVSLANNHILDFGTQGLLDTRHHLATADIACAGAGTTTDHAMTGALARIGSLVIGLMGITDNMPEWRHPDNGACTYYARINDDPATIGAIRHRADALRHAGADIVVLSTHWGWMPIPLVDPPHRYRRFARRAIECGVDIVHGHSSHLLQGVEAYGGGLILYDTGNFIDDYWVLPGFPMDRSAMFMLEFRATAPVRIQIVPLARRRCRTECAKGQFRQTILADIEARCRRLGTHAYRTGNGLAIDLARVPPVGVRVGQTAFPEPIRTAAGT
jgi:poly-gamma-glutamate capsule biosynthesis protein CapA/YwtB (metallophosphatase superfamily)